MNLQDLKFNACLALVENQKNSRGSLRVRSEDGAYMLEAQMVREAPGHLDEGARARCTLSQTVYRVQGGQFTPVQQVRTEHVHYGEDLGDHLQDMLDDGGLLSMFAASPLPL